MAKMKFKVGARMIDAPLADASLADNVKQLAMTYPQFRWTSILDSDAQINEDGSVTYVLLLPPLKPNG
jgi:hypothetical protein